MARWRDVKKGNIKLSKSKKIESNSKNEDFSINATTFTQIKAVITDLFMIIMPLMYISIYLLFGGREGFAQNMLMGWGYILIPYIVITILFFSIKGQTPGLKAYELKLVKTKDHTDANIFQVIIRQSISIFTTMSIIGLFLPFFRKDHRTIHDIIASTTIINFPNK
jgi:uncharacterized RDD family membrane protein YckC